jgi:hypothetical protein
MRLKLREECCGLNMNNLPRSKIPKNKFCNEKSNIHTYQSELKWCSEALPQRTLVRQKNERDQ